MLELLHAVLQPARDPIGGLLNDLEHLPLLLELPTHGVGLLAQVPHRPEHAVQVLVLLAHDLDLLLLLELGVRVVVGPLGDGVRAGVGQVASRSGRRRAAGTQDLLTHLLAHLVDVPADILDEALPPLDLLL